MLVIEKDILNPTVFIALLTALAVQWFDFIDDVMITGSQSVPRREYT